MAVVHGECAGRFAGVREVFEKSFEEGEVGAAVAVTVDGELVVDLWGGHADAERSRPWERDTIANTYSTTKGMTAICANRLVESGDLDLDAPVAEYWPEFAQAGKERVPVRWLLCHKAGLAALSEPLSREQRYDWDAMTRALAAQKPWWTPGEKHGYHALTFGYLVGEVVRRIDGRSLGTYFREELAEPLDLDFHIGFGPELDARVAQIIAAPQTEGQAGLFDALRENPDSLQARAFSNPRLEPDAVNQREWRAAEIPAGNGHGTARGLARIYGGLAGSGEVNGLRVLAPASIERANTEEAYGLDAVLAPIHTRFGLGFMLTQPMIPFGPNPRSFGHPGAGGAIAFADPDARLGFGYVMNQMQTGLGGDARGFSLISAAYEALG